MSAGYPIDLGSDNPQLIEEMIDPDLDDMSIVDHPATDRDLSFFKRVARAVKGQKATPEGVDKATFERCVEHVIEAIDSGKLQSLEGQDPKQTGFAICTASNPGGGKGRTMSVKQDELTLEEPPAIEPSSVIDIPATPKPWPFSRCIEAAGDLGLGRDEAIAACQLVVQEYGTPDDPETILVPDGAKPESLLAISAVAGGLAKPEGVDGSSEEKRAKFRAALPADFKATRIEAREGTVGSHWLGKFKCFLGLDRPQAAAELEKQMLERKVNELSTEQSKTKEDLREFARVMHEDNREWQRIFAASLGIQLPAREEPSTPASPIAAAPLTPPAVAASPEEGKSVPVAPAAKDADPATQELLARCEQLELENAEFRARDESVAALMAEAAAAVAPEQPMAPAAAVAASPPKYARRAGVDPTVPGQKRNGGVEMVQSTYLGVPIPKADRDAYSTTRR